MRFRRFTVFLAAAMLLGVLTVYAMLRASLEPHPEYWLVALAAAIPMLLCATENLAGRNDYFAPITFVLLTLMLGVTFRTWYIVATPDGEEVQAYLLMGQPVIFLSWSLVVTAWGFLFFTFGYYWSVPRLQLEQWPLIRSDAWDERWMWLVVIGCFIIAALSIISFIHALGIQDSLLEKFSAKRRLNVEGADVEQAAMGYQRLGASLISISFMLLFAWFNEKKLAYFSFIGVMVVGVGLLATLFPIIVSSRTQVILLLIFALLISHYLRRPISLQALGIAFLSALIALSALGALRAYSQRQVEELTVGQLLGFSSLAEHVMENRNFLDVTKTGHIMAGMPAQYPYQLGQTLVLWIVSPIPRSLWKGKPAVRLGPDVGDAFFSVGEHQITGVPPGYLGELYINFGLLLIAPGMFFLGWFLRFLYVNFYPLIRHNKNALLIYISLMFPFAFSLPSSDVTGTVLGVLKNLIPLLLILALIGRRRTIPS